MKRMKLTLFSYITLDVKDIGIYRQHLRENRPRILNPCEHSTVIKKKRKMAYIYLQSVCQFMSRYMSLWNA